MKVAPADLLHINALGTVYVYQAFSRRMHKGSVIRGHRVDVRLHSAGMAMLPKAAYALAETV